MEEAEQRWDSLDARQRYAVIEQLLRTGHASRCRQLLARIQARSDDDRLIKTFYEALVLKAEGRHDEAVAIFRKLLTDHPQFERVRLELAHTLYIAQQDESARHHFELILGANANNPDLAAAARSYINAIDGRRSWDFSSFVSIAPSTNLNQGSDSQTIIVNGLPFQLADRNIKKSGVGVIVGAQGGYRLPIADRLEAIATAGANFKRYRQDDFNDGLVNASLGPRYRFDWGYVGVYATFDHRWIADDSFHTSWGGLLSTLVQVSPADLAFTDFGCSERSFSTNWNGSDLSYQDGTVCQVNTRWQHHVDTTSYFNLLSGGGRERAGLEHLNNLNWNGGLGMHKELPWGVSTYVQGLYTHRRYSGEYPTTGLTRRDHRLDASVNLTKRDLEIAGLAPMLQYTYTWNGSNLAFQQFDAHGLNLTLTKRF